MNIIYKYQLKIGLRQIIKMPKNAQILTCHAQNDLPTLWVKVEDSQPLEERNFIIYGTGFPINNKYLYIATIQIGAYVWHIFEDK